MIWSSASAAAAASAVVTLIVSKLDLTSITTTLLWKFVGSFVLIAIIVWLVVTAIQNYWQGPPST